MDLVLVDGPNFFNVVGRALAKRGHSAWLSSYLADWFDIDRLVRATLELDDEFKPGAAKLGTVIFHSNKALGGDPYRFDKEATARFWNRQASLPQTSAVLVEIPGAQQETCRHCNQPDTSTREKGVDTSITSYMFETAANWTTLCLFAKDADFVPPVLSLRRQGKRVFVCHDNIERAVGLVRACQSFVELNVDFLEADIATFAFLRAGGGLDQLVRMFAEVAVIQVIIPLGPRLGATRQLGQVMSIDFRGSMESITAKLEEVLQPTPALKREIKLSGDGRDGCPTLRIGTLALVGEGLDRHRSALGDAAWIQHIKLDYVV